MLVSIVVTLLPRYSSLKDSTHMSHTKVIQLLSSMLYVLDLILLSTQGLTRLTSIILSHVTATTQY
jgi:hypothetical protein